MKTSLLRIPPPTPVKRNLFWEGAGRKFSAKNPTLGPAKCLEQRMCLCESMSHNELLFMRIETHPTNYVGLL